MIFKNSGYFSCSIRNSACSHALANVSRPERKRLQHSIIGQQIFCQLESFQVKFTTTSSRTMRYIKRIERAKHSASTQIDYVVIQIEIETHHRAKSTNLINSIIMTNNKSYQSHRGQSSPLHEYASSQGSSGCKRLHRYLVKIPGHEKQRSRYSSPSLCKNESDCFIHRNVLCESQTFIWQSA